jgi:hypothetical protein
VVATPSTCWMLPEEARTHLTEPNRSVLPMNAHTLHAAGVSSEDFREPWFRLEPAYARAFEREAEKEIGPGHEIARPRPERTGEV